MKAKLRLCIVLLFATAFSAHAQVDYAKQINYHFNRYILQNIQEKVYVQTNSGIYFPGDSLWFKASLVNAINHQPVGKDKLLYVDLVTPDNKLVLHKLFELNQGFTDGCLALSKTFIPGQYKLLAYCNYMRNFPKEFLFQKNIRLVSAEGGQIKWNFNPEVKSGDKGDSVLVKMELKRPDHRELNGQVDIRIQLARGILLGANCEVAQNRGLFRFFVPDSLKLPSALLSVQMNGMSKDVEKFKINLTPQKPDLQFLPEGGDLVAGVANSVAFRGVDVNGNPVTLSGVVTDEKGNELCSFNTEVEGMGMLEFTPSLNTNYEARVNYRDSVFHYPLPEVKEEAYSLHLVKQDKDSIYFDILKTSADTIPYLLMGHCRGILDYMGRGIIEKHKLEVALPTSDFGNGVLAFTLFVNRFPRAERLVYLEKHQDIHLAVQPDKQNTKPDSTTYLLKATRSDGSPVIGNFSLLAWASQLKNPLDTLDNIRDYLLFSSDLTGEVFSEAILKELSSLNSSHIRNLLLMTYGWRRFNWMDIIAYDGMSQSFDHETNMTIDGQMFRRLTGKPVPKNFEISMMLTKKDFVHIDKAKTNDTGEFGFILPMFLDSANFTLQTKNRLNAQQDYRVDLSTNLEKFHIGTSGYDRVSQKRQDPLIDNIPPAFTALLKDNGSLVGAKTKAFKKGKAARIDHYYFPGKDTILIGNVEVRSNYRNKEDSLLNASGEPDVVLKSAQLTQIAKAKPWYSDIWDLLMDQIPGLQITVAPKEWGDSSKYNLVITKQDSDCVYFRVTDNPSGYLYIIVDNDLLNGSNLPLFDFFQDMDPSQIESVNFLSRPKSYSMSSATGQTTADVLNKIIAQNYKPSENNHIAVDMSSLISDLMSEDDQRINYEPSFLFITTKSKQGVFYERTKGLQSMYLQGITSSREYYVPKYIRQMSDSAIMALRHETLFWDPELVTDSTGTAHFTFPFTKGKTAVAFQIEGISGKGEAGSKVFSFSSGVKNTVPKTTTETKPTVKTIRHTDLNPYRQQQLYCGLVVDGGTGTPLAFADLTLKQPYVHECTNHSGEFVLSRQCLKGKTILQVSSPGYRDERVELPDRLDSMFVIQLQKESLVADESGANARSFVRDAIRKSGQLYGAKTVVRGFNRELTSMDGNVYGNTETAFNYCCGNAVGNLNDIRFETVRFKTMEDLNGIPLKALKPNHRNIFYPVDNDVLATRPEFWNVQTLSNFDYSFMGTIEYGGESCRKIRFEQNDQLAIPLQCGILYIGEKSGALRYAAWETNPQKRNEVPYSQFLQANPMRYAVKLVDDYKQVSYAWLNDEILLEGISESLKLNVDKEHIYSVQSRLSIIGTTDMEYKELNNKNPDILTLKGKTERIMVKHPEYDPDLWGLWGLVCPEDNLLESVAYLHEINSYH